VCFFLFFVCIFSNAAFGNEECQYRSIVNELKQNCTGIHDELYQIKKYVVANTVVTGVGTAAAGGALYAGIKKKDFDKKAEELMKKMENIENMSDSEFVAFLKDMARYQEMKEEYDSMCQIKHDYEAQSKKLGDIRTGLMVGNTATAVAGTVISSKNKKDTDSIKDKIQKCLDSIKNNEQKIGQSMFDCERSQYEKLKKVALECKFLSVENMEKVSKQNTASAVVSGVNIGTGTAGIITSVLGNKNKYDQKTKNLNTAANVLAGTSMTASGVSTVINAVTIKSINDNLQASELCEEAINAL
jgi:pantothenate kinase type III